MSIATQIQELHAELPPSTQLLAVSKFQPVEAIEEAYTAGQRLFGESRVQELMAKHKVLPADIEWHFIGHVQTNKLKQLLPCVHTIHGIDRLPLLQEIDRVAAKLELPQPVRCMLQLHIAQEETKFGFTPEECRALLAADVWRVLPHVRLVGIMAMATYTDDETLIAAEFQQAADFFHETKAAHFPNDPSFCELSLGMTSDYPLAIAAGSTMIRVGTRIFGMR